MKQYNPVSVMYKKSLPTNTKSIAAYFTRDYNMINPGHKHVGVQGGFLIVKPNVNAINEYIAIVLKGKFANGDGWYDHKCGETTVDTLVHNKYRALYHSTTTTIIPTQA